ncbi:hypothetical protein BH09SUM1_BH09SUM1_31170 [soil metagenome]
MGNGEWGIGICGWVTAGILICGSAAAAVEPSKSVPLSTKLDAKFFDAAEWNDGQAEFALYDAERVIDAATVHHGALIVTAKETFSRETFARARFPYGQRPVISVVRQSIRASGGDGANPHFFASDVICNADALTKLLRLQSTVTDAMGVNSVDYQLWKEKPILQYSSFRDEIGNGSEYFSAASDAVFEEELPLLLRTVRFEDGLLCDFRLYPAQLTGTSKRRDPIAARVTATAVKDGWSLLIEAQDAREITFVFGSTPSHILSSASYSDGRSLKLKSIERRAAGSVVSE